MPTPILPGLPAPQPAWTSPPMFGSATGTIAAPAKPDQLIRFGQDDTPTPEKEPSFLKGMWEHMKGPAKLSLGERIIALLSPTHLKAGFTDAKKTFAEIRQNGRLGLELMGMTLDVLAIVLTLGIILPLDMLLPGFNVSKTLESFFGGIQRSKEAAKNANAAGDKPEEN